MDLSNNLFTRAAQHLPLSAFERAVLRFVIMFVVTFWAIGGEPLKDALAQYMTTGAWSPDLHAQLILLGNTAQIAFWAAVAHYLSARGAAPLAQALETTLTTAVFTGNSSAPPAPSPATLASPQTDSTTPPEGVTILSGPPASVPQIVAPAANPTASASMIGVTLDTATDPTGAALANTPDQPPIDPSLPPLSAVATN